LTILRGQSTPHGPGDPELNQLRPQDSPVHRWYRFVLAFPPHLVQDYINRFKLTANHRLLDPFCGTGTTIVEAKKLGIPGAGVEANPMAWFAGSVKLDWTPDPTQLLDEAHQIGEITSNLIAKQGDHCGLYLKRVKGLFLKTPLVPCRFIKL
jgi:hypothetical protein